MNRMVLRPSFDSDGLNRLDLMRPAPPYYEKALPWHLLPTSLTLAFSPRRTVESN